jgi:hypothetical protein
MDTLHASCFAYPGARKYPVHTKEAALVSYSSYLREKNTIAPEQLPVIEENFNKAAAYHDLDLNAIREAKRLLLEKKAAEKAGEMLNFSADDVEISLNKIASEDQIDPAIKILLEKRASLSRKALKEPALYVYGVAVTAGRDTDTVEMRKLAALAGIGVGDQDEIEHELLKRGSLIVIPNDARASFYEMHRNLSKMASGDFYKQENLEKICSFFEEMDKTYGLERFYGSEISRPEDVCFKNGVDDLLKEASDLFTIDSLETTLSKKALLERREAVKSFFSTHFKDAKDLTDDQLIEKVASLNAEEAKIFLDQVK